MVIVVDGEKRVAERDGYSEANEALNSQERCAKRAKELH